MRLVGIKISGMHKLNKEKKYLFGDTTYICGPNGSGKSTILQAIQLCLLGYIPGTNKTASSIFQHANGKELKLELRMYGCSEDEPDEIIVIRKYFRSGSKIEETVSVFPEAYDIKFIMQNLEFPILNFNEFLGLTANKQKELLLSVLPSSENAIDSKKYLSSLSEYTENVEEILLDIPDSLKILTSISDIKALNSKLKDMKSDLESQQKRATATVQSLIFYEDYSGVDDVDKLQNQISSIMIKRDKALKYEESILTYENLHSKLSEFDELSDCFENDPDYIDLTNQSLEIEAQISDMEEDKLEIKQTISDLTSEYNQVSRILESKGICPYIEYNCDRVESIIPELETKSNKLIAKINNLEQEISIKNNSITSLSKHLIEIRNQLDNIIKRYELRDSLSDKFNDIKQSISEPIDVSSSELSEQLKQLNDNLVKASANQKYNQLMEIVQKQKLELVDKISFIKAAIKATGENGLQSKIMQAPFENMEKRMQSILDNIGSQDLGNVKFNLEEKANSFTFGFERDGKLIPFELLSSGEKCIFTLIFMIAVVIISDSLLDFILIDDLFDHLDDDRFKTVIDNVCDLSEFAQIILAGVKHINDVENLSIINIGGECND